MVSFFQFPFTPFLPRLKENGDIDASGGNLPTLKYNSQRLAIFRNLELLVIDEISMVRADLLDQIDITLRYTRRKWQQPFGGVQLLCLGLLGEYVARLVVATVPNFIRFTPSVRAAWPASPCFFP